MDEGDDAQIARSRQVALQVIWTAIAIALVALPPVSIWLAALQFERLVGLDTSEALGTLSATLLVSLLWPLQGSIWLAWLSGRRAPGLVAGVALIVLRVVPLVPLAMEVGLDALFFLFLAGFVVFAVLDGLSVWGGTLIGASGALRAPTWTAEGTAKTAGWVSLGALSLGICWLMYRLGNWAMFRPSEEAPEPTAFLDIIPFLVQLGALLAVPLVVMAPVVFAKERVAIPQAVVSALVITTWVGGWSFALQGTLAGVLWTFVVLALVQVCTTLLVIPAAYASWSMRGLAALATASADRPGEAPGS